MKNIQKIEFHTGSREELLPGFASDFPYISSCAEFGRYKQLSVPWHWHQAAVETEQTVQYLHIFDVSLPAGETGSRIWRRYITPFTTAGPEIAVLRPDVPAHLPLLSALRDSFHLTEEDEGHELRLRAALSEIWPGILSTASPFPRQSEKTKQNLREDSRLRQMLAYIHEHYPEKLSVAAIAASAFCSQRECYRLFQSRLRLTPTDYITDYRLQAACRMLTAGNESITAVGHACGPGSSSYFGKIFRLRMGLTPAEYRRK